MSKIIYTDNEYNIYQADYGYIVHNSNYDFIDFHTHLKSFKTAKYIIDMVQHKRIPRHLSRYLLISLYRISDDEEYKAKLNDLINAKANRKQQYYNVNKGGVSREKS